VESSPRAYRLKASNAAPPISTFAGAIPRETCTSGSVRDEDGNILICSANDRGDRGNVGII
jgi:hypothetical protein